MNTSTPNTTPTKTPETPATPPGTTQVSVVGYIHSVAELVADIHKRHRIPHGTAFNIVAWGTTHLESQAINPDLQSAPAPVIEGSPE